VAFSGTLDTASLEEILGFLAATRKSGALHIDAAQASGTLFLANGQLSFATAGTLAEPVGSEAELEVRLVDVCCVIGRTKDGAFDFEADDVPADPSTTTFDTVDILTRADAILVDLPAIQSAIPSIEARPLLPVALGTDAVTLTRDQWPLFRLVDGKRSVRDIANRLTRSSFELCRDLLGLIDEGVVAIEGMDSRHDAARTSGRVGGDHTSNGHAPTATASPASPPPAGAPAEVETHVDLVTASTNGAAGATAANPYDELRALADGDDSPNPFADFKSLSDDGPNANPFAESSNPPSEAAEPPAPSAAGSAAAVVTDVLPEAAPNADADDPARDRGALLRLFSGLRES
jgi:hypothetical protein